MYLHGTVLFVSWSMYCICFLIKVRSVGGGDRCGAASHECFHLLQVVHCGLNAVGLMSKYLTVIAVFECGVSQQLHMLVSNLLLHMISIEI